jgi:hypothetical protein
MTYYSALKLSWRLYRVSWKRILCGLLHGQQRSSEVVSLDARSPLGVACREGKSTISQVWQIAPPLWTKNS